MKNLVWHLLRKNISTGQILGYALANLVGLCVVMVGVQFYRDATSTIDADDPFLSRDYLVLSKRVSGIGALVGEPTTMSADDLAQLANQPWAARVGEFTTADFDVNAAVSIDGRGMSTALFFESIPDEFFDIRPRDWQFAPGSHEIPIVISKDYLALYNFGFAAARGLPQLTEGMISMVPLRISISGNGRQEYFSGRVVGFSSRLNTVAVPQSFMEWANSRFGGQDAAKLPSRVIVEVTDPGNPAIAEFVRSHNMEIAGDKADSGRMAYFLSILTSVVVAVGLIICALAVFVLMLSIFLLLQRNRDKIRALIELGYDPSAVARVYQRLVACVNAVVLLVACGALVIASRLWQPSLVEMGASVASLWPTILVGAAIVFVITVVNILSISRRISRQ